MLYLFIFIMYALIVAYFVCSVNFNIVSLYYIKSASSWNSYLKRFCRMPE